MNKQLSQRIFLIFNILWTVFFIKLLIFNDFELYVNPVLKPFMWFVFIIFLMFWVFLIKEKTESKFDWKYLIFLIPFLLLFLTKSQPLGSQTVQKQMDSSDKSIKGGYYHINENDVSDWKTILKDISENKKTGMNYIWDNITQKNKENIRLRNNAKDPDPDLKEVILTNLNEILEKKDFCNDEKVLKELKVDPLYLIIPENNEGTKTEVHRRNRHVMEKILAGSLSNKEIKQTDISQDKTGKPDHIITTGPEYYTFWNALEKEPDKYLGSKVQVKGRYFRNNEDFLDKQGLISRLVITCCAAHAIPAGIHIQYNKINELENDEWITAEGFVELLETKKGLLPVIELTGVQKTAPESPYIYPVQGAEIPSLNLAKGSIKPVNSHFMIIILAGFLIMTFMITVVGDN